LSIFIQGNSLKPQMKGSAHRRARTLKFSHDVLNQITILIFINNYLSYTHFAENPPIILVP